MNALILASGEGTRLRPITGRIPKPLVAIDGVPLLKRQIDALLQVPDIKKIAVSTMYKGAMIERFLEETYEPSDILVYRELKLTGTAEATLEVWKIVGKDDALIVIYGDVYFDEQEVAVMQFTHMIKTYQRHGESMSFLGYGALKKPPTGVMTIALPSEQVESFIERPETLEYSAKLLVSHAGALILCPEIFPILQELKPNSTMYDLGKDFLPQAIKRKPFHAYEITFHFDVGTMEQYRTLQQRIYNQKNSSST